MKRLSWVAGLLVLGLVGLSLAASVIRAGGGVQLPVQILYCDGSPVANASINAAQYHNGMIADHVFLVADANGLATISFPRVVCQDSVRVVFNPPSELGTSDHTSLLRCGGPPLPGEWGQLWPPSPLGPDCGDGPDPDTGRWLMHYNP